MPVGRPSRKAKESGKELQARIQAEQDEGLDTSNENIEQGDVSL